MIDSHCHLDSKEFDKDRKEVVEEAKRAGVALIINPASDLASNMRIAKIAREFPGYVLPCSGIGPVDAIKEGLDKLENYMDECIAVGEIGLDYYWSKERENQRKNFEILLEMAIEREKPVIVHAREAMADALEILEEKRAEKVILHCFSGTASDAKKAVDLGFYVSFATNIYYRDSKKLIKAVSVDNMLTETDSPYLHPMRQDRNEPKNVKFVLEVIARELELSFKEIERMTEKNTAKAFGL